MNVPVKGTRRARLSNGLILDNTLHIPKFKCNLLSVSKLTKDYNCAIIFLPNKCVIQDLASRKLIGTGRNHNGLYLLESQQKKGAAMKVDKASDAYLWHARLGHASEAKIAHISVDIDLVMNLNIMPCDSCIRAKHTRLPFPLSSIKTKSCFELIHYDIWGRYTTASHSGAYYFLSIVDNFSRGVWIYLMKHKS